MATITVKITKKGLRLASVEKFVTCVQNDEWITRLAEDLLPEGLPDSARERQLANLRTIICGRAPYLPKEVTVATSVYEPPESRADRLAEAESMVGDAKNQVEDLRGELESWRDNLPEQFETKREELDEAISGLEEIESSLDEVDFSSVSFPSAFGA